jgi:hypothetical protein
MKAWHADPLVRGHGPRVFEVFLEPTCPFSVEAFGKLEDLLDQAGEDRVTVKVRLQSQPWHMYSAVIGAPPRPSQTERLPRNPSWRWWPRIARNSNSTVIAECTGKADSDRRRSSWSAATRVQRLSTSRFSPRPSSTGHPHPRRGTERMNLSPSTIESALVGNFGVGSNMPPSPGSISICRRCNAISVVRCPIETMVASGKTSVSMR